MAAMQDNLPTKISGFVLEGVGIEAKKGPTPSGGVLLIAYFLDDDRNLVPKEQATGVDIYELDANDKLIAHQTAKIKKR